MRGCSCVIQCARVLSLFPGAVGSEPAGELSWQNLFQERTGLSGLQPSRTVVRCLLLSLSTRDIYRSWRRAREWGNGERSSFWQDWCEVWEESSLGKGALSLQVILCAWISRVAVWSATLLNI